MSGVEVSVAKKFIEITSGMIMKGFTKRESFVLLNPNIIYNARNVAGVQVDIVNMKELEEYARGLNRKLGFVKAG